MGADLLPLRASLPPPLPVARMVLGQPVEEVAVLIPRLFNLCRAAQEAAVKLALGLPLDASVRERLAADFARDHLVKLGVMLPRRLGLDPLPIAGGAEALLPDALPRNAEAFERYLARDEGFAPVLREIHARFAPGEAVATLPEPDLAALPAVLACENSVAARHLGHPLMRSIEAWQGRGPLWRVVARLLDLEACLSDRLPMPERTAGGWVVVPASRGAYAMRAGVRDGMVCRFQRVTPTDHMMAPGGLMAQSLASLPEAKHDLAALVVDILDPCSPVALHGGRYDA